MFDKWLLNFFWKWSHLLLNHFWIWLHTHLSQLKVYWKSGFAESFTMTFSRNHPLPWPSPSYSTTTFVRLTMSTASMVKRSIWKVDMIYYKNVILTSDTGCSVILDSFHQMQWTRNWKHTTKTHHCTVLSVIIINALKQVFFPPQRNTSLTKMDISCCLTCAGWNFLLFWLTSSLRLPVSPLNPSTVIETFASVPAFGSSRVYTSTW